MFCTFSLKRIVTYTAIIIIFAGMLFASNYIAIQTIETSTSISRLIPIYSVERVDKWVSITFDCAWGADDISDIINVLNENDVKATFFTVGEWVEKYPNEVKKLHDAGMEIGNHSDTHAHVNKLSLEENIKDMKKCNERIEKITNQKVKFYRGPYGEYNNSVIKAAESLNMQVIQWDVDTLDYDGKTVDEMCQRIKSKIQIGSIILMHNDTKYTAVGLQQIINTIKEEGYEIVPLSELIYEDNYKINHEGRQIQN